jgi:hypothetical protein
MKESNMLHRASPLVTAALATVLLSITGCSGRYEPSASDLGRVTGTVTLDGEPVPNAILMLRPDAEGAHQSIARADDKGFYKAMYYTDLEGVQVGPCTVIVTFGMDLSRGVVPPKYSSESELKFEVMPGDNTYNVEMTSR